MNIASILKLRDMMRVTASAAAIVLATSGGSVLAQNIDVTSSNDITGPNSLNEGEFEIDRDWDLDFDVETDAEFDIEFDFETGDVDIDSNTTVGDTETGGVAVAGDFVNDFSGLSSGLCCFGDGLGGGEITADFSNFITGPESENTNSLDVRRDVDIDVNKELDIETDFEADVNTGDLDVRNNTIVGDLATGEILMDLNFENTAGDGDEDCLCDLLGGVSGDITADFSNDTTGPNSSNQNKLEVRDEVDVDINHETDVENDIELDANTGGSDINNNTIVGDFTSGDVRVRLDVLNMF